MRRTGLKLAGAAILAVAMLVGGAAVVLGAGQSRPEGEALVPAAASGGPVGRLAVAGPWIEAPDPDDLGLHLGWAGGGFGGALVTVPHVANAAKVTGAAGVAAYRGGVAWYPTTLTAPRPGSFALRLESVHHVPHVWRPGHRLRAATGPPPALQLRVGVRRGRAPAGPGSGRTPAPPCRSSSGCGCARACRTGSWCGPTTASRPGRSATAGTARGSTTAASAAR